MVREISQNDSSRRHISMDFFFVCLLFSYTVEQWKKYSLNGTQINNGKANWNELMEGNIPGTSNLAWNENPNSVDGMV